MVSPLYLVSASANAATPNWDVSGLWESNHHYMGNYYTHENNLTQDASGNLSGSGGWNGAIDGIPSLSSNSWDVITGTVSGNTISFDYDYTSGESCSGNIFAVVSLDGSMTGTWEDNCDGERSGYWAAAAGTARNIRRAAITAPDVNEEVYGIVNFAAYLSDNDQDHIQWAVRKGTCEANTGTVFGNVDDKTDLAVINNSDPTNQTFHYQANMSGFELGMYCFVYNPVEDAGEIDIRLTRQFQLAAEPQEPESPLIYPIDKEQCKNEGWMGFTDIVFKNQGQCVSYVQANENAGKKL